MKANDEGGCFTKAVADAKSRFDATHSDLREEEQKRLEAQLTRICSEKLELFQKRLRPLPELVLWAMRMTMVNVFAIAHSNTYLDFV